LWRNNFLNIVLHCKTRRAEKLRLPLSSLNHSRWNSWVGYHRARYPLPLSSPRPRAEELNVFTFFFNDFPSVYNIPLLRRRSKPSSQCAVTPYPAVRGRRVVVVQCLLKFLVPRVERAARCGIFRRVYTVCVFTNRPNAAIYLQHITILYTYTRVSAVCLYVYMKFFVYYVYGLFFSTHTVSFPFHQITARSIVRELSPTRRFLFSRCALHARHPEGLQRDT